VTDILEMMINQISGSYQAAVPIPKGKKEDISNT